jgi:hypothetical protein
MKYIIIAWFIGFGLLFLILTKGFDALYENVYFNKLTPEQQEVVMEWLKSDEI